MASRTLIARMDDLTCLYAWILGWETFWLAAAEQGVVAAAALALWLHPPTLQLGACVAFGQHAAAFGAIAWFACRCAAQTAAFARRAVFRFALRGALGVNAPLLARVVPPSVEIGLVLAARALAGPTATRAVAALVPYVPYTSSRPSCVSTRSCPDDRPSS